jgi:hypothetical protein
MKSELDHSKSLTGTRARSTPPISWRIVFDEGFYSCFKDSSQPSLQHHPEFPVIYPRPGPPNLQEMVSWCSWLSHVSNTHKVPRSSLGEIIPFFFCLETLHANSGDVPIGSPHPRHAGISESVIRNREKLPRPPDQCRWTHTLSSRCGGYLFPSDGRYMKAVCNSQYSISHHRQKNIYLEIQPEENIKISSS